MLSTKDDNFKESFQNLQESLLQYMVENYKKRVYLAPLTNKLEDVELSIKEPTATKVTGNKGPT